MENDFRNHQKHLRDNPYLRRWDIMAKKRNATYIVHLLDIFCWNPSTPKSERKIRPFNHAKKLNKHKSKNTHDVHISTNKQTKYKIKIPTNGTLVKEKKRKQKNKMEHCVIDIIWLESLYYAWASMCAASLIRVPLVFKLTFNCFLKWSVASSSLAPTINFS